jgi:ribosomal protein L19E
MYESLVVSKSEKEKVRGIIKGLKIVIKKAKHVSESRLRETLSKTFALRIAHGANVFVND